MTMYRDIYQDLPSRVYEVWQQTKNATGNPRDLSVTAMLMAAATGFAMPWESLKDVGAGNRDEWNAHPSFVNGDQAHYQSVLRCCDEFLSKKIPAIPSLKSVSFRKCSNLSAVSGVAECGDAGEPVELENCNVRCVIRVLRNALAHNNILAFGSKPENIKRLGFFSEYRIGSGCASTVDGYLVVTFSIADFQDFLEAWFLMLRPEKTSPQ